MAFAVGCRRWAGKPWCLGRHRHTEGAVGSLISPRRAISPPLCVFSAPVLGRYGPPSSHPHLYNTTQTAPMCPLAYPMPLGCVEAGQTG